MSRRTKPRVLYMHTLEGRPALFLRGHFIDESRAYIAFAGGSAVATLATSLRQIRREQRVAIRSALAHSATAHWANRALYGYVRVEVP